MPELLTHFEADRGSLDRLYATPYSAARRDRMRSFYSEWRNRLETLPFETFSRSDRADALLFGSLLERELHRLEREERRFAEIEPLIPFASGLISLEDARRHHEEVDPEAAATLLAETIEELRRARGEWEARRAAGADIPAAAVVCRAADALPHIQAALDSWFNFHYGYDPLFTWWVERPYRALTQSLQEYAGFLRKEVAGVETEDALVGDPIGREALEEELRFALVACTPEELMAIAEQERAWCETQLCRAARDMGCGDDWRAALERVKAAYGTPGKQPALVRELAQEAVRYVEERDLLTIPRLARECWRMEMMSPERQKVNPFFLGGETITVSFPTQAMEHAEKRMSQRSNNRHFARATVQHELIPGHYLQSYSMERNRPYRHIFQTPFWIEGWTLHWEMLLWDLGFAETPEDRIGMLFWRLHRCIRVLFSLGFHLGQRTPQECVEMLMHDVGHEVASAIGEVRRSIGGDYEPLYQCAYLIGGLQTRALHRELVGTGRMSQRAFHDAFLQESCMPIAMLRALLTADPLAASFRIAWRFYPPETGDGPPGV